TSPPELGNIVEPWRYTQPPPQTAAATGKQKLVDHRAANTIQDPHCARSAIAPEISATVMIAKVAPNATPIVPSPVVSSAIVASSPKSAKGLPAKLQLESTEPMLKPKSTQSTATSPMAPKLIIIMLTTLLAFTSR